MNAPINDFKSNIENRADQDILVSQAILYILLLIPVFLFATFVLIEGTSNSNVAQYIPAKLFVLDDYIIGFCSCIAALISFFTMAMIYIICRSVSSHSARDIAWRQSLIGYVQDIGGSVEELVTIDGQICNKEKFKRKWIIYFLMGLSVVTFTIQICVLFPIIQNCGNMDFSFNYRAFLYLSILLTYIPCIIGLLALFLKVYSVSYYHEIMQVQFTEALSEVLKTKGIEIVPMHLLCSKPHVLLGLLLAILTFGLGTIALLLVSNKTMNNHVYNQWYYEMYLLEKLEGKPIEHDYGSITFSKFKHLLAERIKNKAKTPKPIFLAEVFILILIANYSLKLIGICIDNCFRLSLEDLSMHEKGPSSVPMTFEDIFQYTVANNLESLAMCVLTIVLIVLAVNTVTGLKSAKIESWKKVARTCFTFSGMAILSAFVITSGFGQLFEFNVYLTISLLYSLFLMLILSRTVKAYYTPYGQTIPPTSAWIRYSVTGKMKWEDTEGQY